MARTIYPISRNYIGSVVKPRYFGGVSGAFSQSSGFSPSDIAGLQLWLKADAITGVSDGGTVATWNDSSGNGNNATQSTEANKPTYHTNIINGLPVVRFDPGGDYLNLPDFVSGFTSAEIFIVIKLDNDPPVSGGGGLWNFGSAADSTHYPFTDGVIYDDFGTDTRKTTGNPTPALTSFRLYNVSSSSGNWTSRIDGTQHFTTATNTVGWITAPTLGASGVGIYHTDGDMAEIILYSQVLSSTDRSQIQDYLDSKYALSF